MERPREAQPKRRSDAGLPPEVFGDIESEQVGIHMGIHHLRPPDQYERQHALLEIGPMEIPRGEHIR